MMGKEQMRRQATAAAADFPPRPLRPISTTSQSDVNKAGVIPYLRADDGRVFFFLMRPCSKERQHENPSKLQICKGTREVFNGSEWEDFLPETAESSTQVVLEPLQVTALREGIEEIGLRIENIKEMPEWGPVTFLSETTEVTKTMWLFLAHVNDRDAFDQPDAEHADTVERQWVVLPEDGDVIRKDHLEILQAIDSVLKQ